MLHAMGRTLALSLALCAAAACSKKKNESEGLPPAQNWSGDPSGMAQPAQQPNTPHAAAAPTNPHAGMGTDVSQLGLPPPDPNRPIDPSHHVKGFVKIHPKAKDRVKPGTAVFLLVKRADASGQPTGTPLAVEKLEWGAGDTVPFALTEQRAMIAGTQLTGDVVVIAHYDQDGDAICKQPGDVMGQVKVKITADNVTLILDDVLQSLPPSASTAPISE